MLNSKAAKSPRPSEAPRPNEAVRVAEASERARIVAALIEVGAEHGYLDTTIEMIVERAGLERDAFDRHFATKYDCFLTTWNEINDECVAHIMAVYERHEAWADRLRAVAHDIARSLELDPQRGLFGIEVLAAGRAARARRDMTMRAITALIDAGRNEMEDRDAVPRTTAEALAGAAYSQMFSKVADGAHDELPALVPQLMSAAVMPYLGVEAALAELRMGEDPAP